MRRVRACADAERRHRRKLVPWVDETLGTIDDTPAGHVLLGVGHGGNPFTHHEKTTPPLLTSPTAILPTHAPTLTRAHETPFRQVARALCLDISHRELFGVVGSVDCVLRCGGQHGDGGGLQRRLRRPAIDHDPARPAQHLHHATRTRSGTWAVHGACFLLFSEPNAMG